MSSATLSAWFFQLVGAISHVLAFLVRTFGSSVRAPMAGETTVSAAWLTSALRDAKTIGTQRHVRSVVLETVDDNRGLAGVVTKVTAVLDDSSTVPLVVKRSHNDVGGRTNVAVGCWWREARFLARMARDDTTAPFTSSVVAAHWSTLLCEYTLVMRDLTKAPYECMGVNLKYGNQIWGDKGHKLDDNGVLDLVGRVWLSVAPMHAKFWNDRSLVAQDWLRGASWLRGEGQTRWNLSLESTRRCWNNGQAKVDAIRCDARLRALISRSIAASSFDEFLLHISNTPFTLTHGDFHASNMMVNAKQQLQLLDWSEVGLCEPGADLGQTLISDVQPHLYAKIRPLLDAYHAALVQHNRDIDYPLEQFVADFGRATISRWVFMTALLCSFPLPPALLQYFHDNLLAFIKLYGDLDGTYPLRHMVSILRS
jgi:hypothetical protein